MQPKINKLKKNVYGVSFGDNVNVLKLDSVMVHNSVNTLKITELYSLKEWILWYELHLNKVVIKIKEQGNSLAVQWLGLGVFIARAQVRSLAGELTSYKPLGVAKN